MRDTAYIEVDIGIEDVIVTQLFGVNLKNLAATVGVRQIYQNM